MSEIILFLGAGASVPFGYPTTVEFMNNISGDNISDPEQIFKDIYSFLTNKNGKDIPVDIEQILWGLDELKNHIEIQRDQDGFIHHFFTQSSRFAYQYNKVNNQTYEWRHKSRHILNSIIKIREDINKLVYETYWQPKKPGENVDSTYKYLFKKFIIPIDIFTTNYDLSVERVCVNDDKLSKIFYKGFQSKNIGQAYRWNPDLYNNDNFKIKLYKLHGSLNWKYKDDYTTGNKTVMMGLPTKDYTGDELIIYPGVKDIPHKEPFKTLHELFAQSLKTAYFAVFIGFSFRDDYINQLIEKALNENELLQLIIWNPVIPNNGFKKSRILEYKNFFKKKNIDGFLEIISKRYNKKFIH